eukprot:scaffold87605_cov17-Prasinocladus_malaysianus.AAC.1
MMRYNGRLTRHGNEYEYNSSTRTSTVVAAPSYCKSGEGGGTVGTGYEYRELHETTQTVRN